MSPLDNSTIDSPSIILHPDIIRRQGADEFISLQKSDAEINTIRNKVESGEKCDFFLHANVLYREDDISGYCIHQLVVPFCKRKDILTVGHDNQLLGHFGCKKTLIRIKYALYWPGMEADVTSYVSACELCQRHERVTKKDRVPIVPIVRAPVPFDQIHVDVLGELPVVSSKGHRCDGATRPRRPRRAARAACSRSGCARR